MHPKAAVDIVDKIAKCFGTVIATGKTNEKMSTNTGRPHFFGISTPPRENMSIKIFEPIIK